MRYKGFTLIELMVTISVLGVIAAIAIPAASDYIDHRKIINAAEAVYGQLQYARSQAIARSEKVYSSFDYSDDGDWLMAVSTVDNCDLKRSIKVIEGTEVPDAATDCTLVVENGDGVSDEDDLTYHLLSGANFNGVLLDANDTGTGGAPNKITFDPTRGTAESRDIFLWLDRGPGKSYLMRVDVSVIGKVTICSPSANQKVPGYSACP